MYKVNSRSATHRPRSATGQRKLIGLESQQHANHLPARADAIAGDSRLGIAQRRMQEMIDSGPRVAHQRSILQQLQHGAAQRLAISSVVQAQGLTTSEKVNNVVNRVQREVGGGRDGLGTVPTGTKLALAVHFLQEMYGIRIDRHRIQIERDKEKDDFELLRVLLRAAIDQQTNFTETPGQSTADAETDEPKEEADAQVIKALRDAKGDCWEALNKVIGSPSAAADAMAHSDLSPGTFFDSDAELVLHILTTAGLLKRVVPEQPRPPTQAEINFEKHDRTAKKMRAPSGRIKSKQLFVALANCLVAYSKGPDTKTYPYSVEFSEKSMRVGVIEIERSRLNSANDVGLGTNKKGGTLESELSDALFRMSELIRTEFEKDTEDARALYGLWVSIRGLVMENCNQDNAKLLVEPLKKIAP